MALVHGRLARRSAVVFAAVLSMSLAACSSTSSSSTSSGTGEASAPKVPGATESSAPDTSPAAATAKLTVGLAAGPNNLDPAKDSNSPFATLVRGSLINETLLHANQDGTVGPGLATEWGYVGEGNRVFELTLRDDAKFSDGSPVDAEAVKAWLDYMVKTAGPSVKSLGSIEKVTTEGTNKVQIHLTNPNPMMPNFMTEVWGWGQVVGPKGLADPESLGTTTNGAGPYMLDPSASVVGDHYTLVPNPNYYDKSKVKFESITVKIIPDPQSMLAAVQTGQVDIALGDPLTADQAKQAGVEVLAAKSGRMAGVIFADRTGKTSEPLADARVRQAMNYAIDRETISQALLPGHGTPTSEVLSPGGDPTGQFRDYYNYDPAKAKQLLAEAGYPDGFEFEMLVPTFQGAVGTPLAQAIAQNLADVGINVKLKNEAEFGSFVTSLLSGKYPAALYGSYGGPVVLPWYLYNDSLGKDALWNVGHAVDPEIDAMWEEASSSADPGPIWEKMIERTVKEALFAPVVEPDVIYYTSDNIDGVTLTDQWPYPMPQGWTPK